MARTNPTLALAVILALALTGCIQNMGGLRDALGATDEALERTDEALNATSAALNATGEALQGMRPNATDPPVARISIFAGNGALVYKSTFQADDPAEIVFVDEKTTLSAIAGESEAFKGATIAAQAWTLNGKALEGAGSKASVEVGEAGLYLLNLTVTDSNGKSDTHSVKLGVAPKPFDVVTELVTGPVIGAEGAGQNGEATFDLALDESEGPAMIQSVTFTALPPATCDAILEVLGPDGESLGSEDAAGNGGAEEIKGGALDVGAYAIVVGPFACVAPEGVPVSVTVTYLPMVPGLDAGDGHGHRH